MGPIVLAVCFVLLRVLYLAFAFLKPPSWLESFLRIPSIFVFLPESSRVRVGRLSVGAFLILGTLALCAKVVYTTRPTVPPLPQPMPTFSPARPAVSPARGAR